MYLILNRNQIEIMTKKNYKHKKFVYPLDKKTSFSNYNSMILKSYQPVLRLTSRRVTTAEL